MKTEIAYIHSTNGSFTFILNGEIHSIDKSHQNYPLIKEAVKDKSLFEASYEELKKLFDPNKAVEVYLDGKAKVVDNTIYFKGQPVHNSLTKRILDLMKEGLPFDYMMKFLENLMENPSQSSINELYDFLENKNLPITEDGHFLAYKAVRNDFKDIYSGRFSNEIGNVLEMSREQVDSNRERECSFGFHVGALDYVSGYGREDGKFLIVKVNPKDAVSVPRGHNAQKLRVCRYEVLREMENPKKPLERAGYTPTGKFWTQERLEDELWNYLRNEDDIKKTYIEVGEKDVIELESEMIEEIARVVSQWENSRIDSFLESLDFDFGYEENWDDEE